MQSPSLPPEIPKHSLLPVWLGASALLAIGVGAWALLGGSSQKEAGPEPDPPASVVQGSAPTPAPAPPGEAPPPPPPPEQGRAASRGLGAIPGDAPALPGGPATDPAAARRDPNCDDPCRGKETAELVGALRAKAAQARSCYERALSNDSALAGKLEIGVRVGTNGAACSASVNRDTLGDAAVKSCALARFRGANYPKPTGGCVDVSVPMNFMPAGSR